jgi:bifunctional ADP-heptose synthase (sugar kinase/adenylyltransferase)
LGTSESRESFVRSHLAKHIKQTFFRLPGARTIVKRRFVDPNFLNKMFEVAYLDDRNIPEKLEKEIVAFLQRELPRYDIVIVADYGHGLITPKIVDTICKKSKFLCVNTQTNSANIGFNVITKYPRADYVCIDEPELRLSERDKYGPIEALVQRTMKHMKPKAMVVTRGHRGALAFSKATGYLSIPVFSSTVVDRTGAGDAFLCLSALCIGAGLPVNLAAFVGNAAGALKVGTVCNRNPVEPVGLYKFITSLLK